MKVYTIKDIASIAGVSVTTVSRVLNHRPDVNSATRERVEKVIRDCHFVGNTNARGLKQGNEVIGVVIRGRSNPFLSALAEAILSQADHVPENFVTEYIDEKDDEFQTALRMSLQNRLKGLLFVGSLIDDRVRSIRGMEVPMVFKDVLKKLRTENGITQEELATLLNVTRPTVAGYETKGKEPDFKILILL